MKCSLTIRFEGIKLQLKVVSLLVGAVLTAATVLGPVRAQASQFEAVASTEWSFQGVSLALPESDPFGFVQLGISGARSGMAAADNFFSGISTQQDTRVLRISNPLADSVFVSLAFSYRTELYFGSDGLWEDPPAGDHDVDLRAGVDVAAGAGTTRALTRLVIDTVLSCPSTACSNRYRLDEPIFGFGYVDLTLNPLEARDIHLRSYASVTVIPYTGESGHPSKIPVPASIPLLLTGLGALVALRQRTRPAA